MIKQNEIFAANDVNCGAIYDFINNCKLSGTDIHTLEIYKKDELKVRLALPPYSCENKLQLYSLSKSFSSTAIGLLVTDGALSVDDKLVDIFPDRTPENVSERMKKLCVKHILSMNTGHAECPLSRIKNSDDIVRAFMSEEQAFEPGTHFMYNNAATYMLSEIVTRLTGMTMLDFLSVRLFAPLGIENMRWDTFKSGKNQGAVGLHASADDLSKLGRLYLNNGMWYGKRILSEDWVKTASAPHSDNSANGTADWTAGYGFQFWVNAREGYRGDGAFGQLCVILPEKEVVAVIQCLSADMQSEMNHLYTLIDSLHTKGDASSNELKDKINILNLPEKTQVFDKNIFGNIYRCNENPCDISLLSFDRDSCGNLILNFSDGEKNQQLAFGCEKYLESDICIRRFKPALEELARTDRKENVRLAAYYTYNGDKLTIHVRYLNNPHTDCFEFSFTDTGLVWKAEDRYEISAKLI